MPWHEQVWFSGSVLKQSFTMWLGCFDRLPTLSVEDMGMLEDDTCFLCEIYCEIYCEISKMSL